MDGKYKGETPYTYTSGALAGSSKIVVLKKEGYKDTTENIRRGKLSWVMLALGVCFIVPLLWVTEYLPEYTFELQKLESKPSDLTPKPQVTPPKKPTTSTPVTPSMGTEKIVTVTWTFANIRSGAGDNYSVVTTVKQGDKLTVIGEFREWFNVRLENDQQGWISNRVVK